MKFYPCLVAVALASCAASLAFAQSYSFTIVAGTPPLIGSNEGTGTEARFNSPGAVALDAAGNTYVADRLNHVVRKITPAGVVTTLAGVAGSPGIADGLGSAARLDQPGGIAIDAAGNLFVTDRAAFTIRKITAAGEVSTLAGLPNVPGYADGVGSGARFSVPYGIAIDRDGMLFVVDGANRVIRKVTPAGVVTTLAGGAGIVGHVDATGTNARFDALAGLAIDGAGNLYAADTSSAVIRKITPAGVVTTLAGLAYSRGTTNGLGAAARFSNPLGIAADRDGTVYVADTSNETIRKITPDGTVSLFAGVPGIPGNINASATTARFFRPTGLALDSAGNVIIADTSNHTIRRISASGTVTTLAGGGGNFGSTDGFGTTARFYHPRGLAIDGQGNVFVADSFNNTVRRISSAGIVSTFAGAPSVLGYTDGAATTARFGFPYGVAIDGADKLFVVDQLYNAVRSITAGDVRTYAGVPGTTPGSTDGGLSVARFNFPTSVAVDRDGTVYVSDTFSHTIRKVSTAGVITTLAGLAGTSGTADGTGSVARFNQPSGIAIDASGTLFIADFGNSAIRRVTSTGEVSLFAGVSGVTGATDGTGANARFQNPEGIAFDAAGNLFVADSNNHMIRKITPSGVVTTIAGQSTNIGVAAGTAGNAQFFLPTGITVDRTGVIYVTSTFGNVIMRGALDSRPAITAPPQSHQVIAGTAATFSVSATGGGLSYQWKRNGIAITGATTSNYTAADIGASATGDYTVDVINSAGSITSAPATLRIVTTGDVGRITNLAIRSQAGTGAQTLIVGVAIGGSGTAGSKPVLIRGAGPTLTAFGVTGALADPKLELYNSANAKISENDDWGGNAQVGAVGGQVGAFAFGNATSKDAALYNPTFASGTYSVWITGATGGTGVALAEIYDATPNASYTSTTPRLTNVSARTQVGTGGDILIAGFSISGQTSKTVLIRAVGPTLAAFGVPGALNNPKLELFSGSSLINENDDWGGAASTSSAFFSVGAFALPTNSRDAVLLVTLAPGSYTAQVSGVGGTAGVALVEVYEVP